MGWMREGFSMTIAGFGARPWPNSEHQDSCAGSKALVQAPSGMPSASTRGKAKSQEQKGLEPPARDQSLLGGQGHSHSFLCPPRASPPARCCTAQELRCQHHKILLCPSCPRHCQHMPCLCRTYHTRRQLGPSHPRCLCSGGFPEPHFRCSWAPGKGTKEPFSSPASPGAEGEGERKGQCLQNTTIGRKFSPRFSRFGVFFPPLFLF